MWREIKSVWGNLRELLEVPRYQDQTLSNWIISQIMISVLLIVIILFNFKEFITGWRAEKRDMFKECSVCRDGYDISKVDYVLSTMFCPQCVKALPEGGLTLIQKFGEWGEKQTDKEGKSIGAKDVMGILLSVYYAIKHKAPREPLFDALNKYTWGNVSDTLTLVELLEELTIMQENKLKPLKSNINEDKTGQNQ